MKRCTNREKQILIPRFNHLRRSERRFWLKDLKGIRSLLRKERAKEVSSTSLKQRKKK
jgi:hypothetical protein